MNGKQLKNSILQWAIQGKLVPQDPNDEPASVLLERIRAEKARLVKEKKIKKDKNESIIYRGDDNSYYEKFITTGEVKCIDEEIPFEIPKGWEWCRLNDLADIVRGGSPRPAGCPEYYNGNIPFLKVADLTKDSQMYVSSYSATIKEAGLKKTRMVAANTLLLTNSGATLGVPKVCTFETTFNDGIAAFLYLAEELKPYLYWFLCAMTDIYRNINQGTAQPNLNTDIIKDTLFAMPPIEEQGRIIKRIEELIPIISKFSLAQNKLSQLNADINANIKKSILQEAIQGKLVPQIEEEGTAQELPEQIKVEKQRLVKEGKLKKSALTDSIIFRGDDNKYWEKNEKEIVCIDDEIPFEIPATWIWVRLDDICSYIQRGKSPKYSPIKKYPVIAQKCNQWAGFCIDKAQFIDPNSLPSYLEERLLQDGDLMWNSTGLGTLGRMAIYQSAFNPYELAVADSHVTVIRPLKEHILSQYLYYYFASDTVQSVIEDKSDGSTKQKELSTTTVKNYLVPIPPYREQQRIVEKIKTVTSIMRG